MLNLTFAETSPTFNRFAVEHIAEGEVVRFDIVNGISNNLEIVLQDTNNDYGRRYPYSIKFAVKTNVDGTLIIKPTISPKLVKDFGEVGRSEVVYQFQKRLIRKMALRW